MKISLEKLREVALNALYFYQYTPQEAALILDVLLYAQLRGNNQGIVKLTGAGIPKSPQAGAITIQRETPLSALIDGARNLGMIVMSQAVQLAISKAHENSIGIVGTRNTNTSTGAIGYYANQIAQEGLIGIVASGSGEYVAMYGSYEPQMGTNPIAFGIPTQTTPVVFDMATAAIARFGIVEAQTAGRAIPEGVAYDRDGNLTTDPAAALQGAIRAFGGYKGAALALMVEIMTQPLVGTSLDANGHKSEWGNFVLAIDPVLLVDRDDFYAGTAALVQRIKNSKKLPGVSEIDVPGERGNRTLQAVLDAGEIEIEANLWNDLQAVANRYKPAE